MTDDGPYRGVLMYDGDCPLARRRRRRCADRDRDPYHGAYPATPDAEAYVELAASARRTHGIDGGDPRGRPETDDRGPDDRSGP